MPNSRAILPQRLARLTKLRGLTQADLARRLGMQPSNLNHYIKGHGDVRSTLLLKLLAELGVDVESAVERELERLSGSSDPSRMSSSDALGAIVGEMEVETREAFLGFTARFAEAHLGAGVREKLARLKAWMEPARSMSR